MTLDAIDSPAVTGFGPVGRPRLLLVEDDPDVAGSLAGDLAADRFDVAVATTGEEALRRAADTPPDVVLVDVGLPDMSGLDVVSALRDGSAHRWDAGMVILIVSGASEPQSIVRGFGRGADDYVVKPFNYPELLARIGGCMRRARGGLSPSVIRVGPLEIDRRALCVFVHGARVDLPAKEFELLAALAGDPSRVLAKGELLRDVWGFPSATRSRTIDTHASRLRRRLADAGLQGWIRNVWGYGYRLLPEAR